jgi:DNA modification methylase
MIQILTGDCRDILPTLEPESVQTCVTSPPYWGLRDYGTAEWEGGDAGCDHVRIDLAGHQSSGLEGGKGNVHNGYGTAYKQECHCGARRIDSQLGLETTPEEYITKMVAVFREVWRVLRNDGTLWVNMGDSYSGYHGNRKASYEEAPSNKNGYYENQRSTTVGVSGLKPKDLCLMPSRLAQALQQPFYIGDIKAEKDRVWMAAIIDGEGSIFIHRKPEGTPTGRNGTSKYTRASFCAGIAISNTNKILVDHAASILGKDNVTFCESKTEHSRDSWQWRITGNRAKKVLLEVYPYLVAKQREARLAIDCPPSGDRASAIWQALKDAHKGIESTVDAPEPDIASLWEPGWYLRSEIVWSKPNPMPESCTDRPTKAHEMIYLLAKNGGNPLIWRARDTGEWSYKPDLSEMISVPINTNYACSTLTTNGGKGPLPGDKFQSGGYRSNRLDPIRKDPGTDEIPRWKGFDYFYDADAIREPIAESSIFDGRLDRTRPNGKPTFEFIGGHSNCGNSNGQRNKRSVWTVATQPYPEAHFATFPEDLIKPCILAGTKPGDTVLDPFAGSGTTGKVALELGRKAILIELKAAYIELASERTNVTAGFF